MRLSLRQGAGISTLGLVLGVVALQLAFLITSLTLQILLLLSAWFAFWFFSHDLTHHIVGTLGGIRFRYYFLGRSAITKLKLPLISSAMAKVPILVLKLDRDSMGKASPRARKWMHASGAIVSMALPWIVVVSAFSIGPFWVGVMFTLLMLGNDIFTLYFSPKTGDLYRARMVQG